jgi:hypothetical protein
MTCATAAPPTTSAATLAAIASATGLPLGVPPGEVG